MRFVDPKATTPLMTQPWTRHAYMTRVERGTVADEDRALGASLYLAEVSYGPLCWGTSGGIESEGISR